MGLDNYAVACKEFSWELKESLTREGVAELRTDCASLGWQSWNQWEKKNFEEIASYVLSTPSARNRKKAWREIQHRSRLILGAIRHVERARVILECIEEYDLRPGRSYREMAYSAGLVYLHAAFSDIPRWPFPGKDPFSD